MKYVHFSVFFVVCFLFLASCGGNQNPLVKVETGQVVTSTGQNTENLASSTGCEESGSTTPCLSGEEKILSKKLPEPSFPALPDCTWKKTSGHGIKFWSQDCNLSGKTKIRISASETGSTFFTEYSTGGAFKKDSDILRVFETNGDTDTVINTLLSENALSADSLCKFQQVEGFGTGEELSYFVLAPTGSNKESGCGKYGVQSEQTSHFVGLSSNPNIFLYINQSKLSPLIDEVSLTPQDK